jgi:flagellar protein FliS
MSSAIAINAYKNVGIDTGVTSADPHKLISMLYQGALLAIANAKNSILRRDIPARGKAISHAIKIINDGLSLSLDKEVGGDLALNLSALYEYMTHRLLFANINSDMEALDEVARLLGELKEAWESIRQPALMTTAPAARPVQPEQLLYARA